jgi:hypothetical protein
MPMRAGGGGSFPAMAPKAEVTDVNDELKGSGVAFADMIRLTGEAVAKTQLELEKTAADTISALSTTQVPLIAAELVSFNDNGAITGVQTVQQDFPVITIVDPPVYQWEDVRAQGQFFASEFASASSATTSVTTTSSGLSTGGGGFLGLFFGQAKASFQIDHTTTTLDTENESDVSFGRMRLNALLTPRGDTGVPKPRRIVQGPSIRIALLALDPLTAPDANGERERTQHLEFEYLKFDGTPINNAQLSVETQGVPWEFETATTTTDAQGKVQAKLLRTIPQDGDIAPIDVVITARIGLVRESIAARV